MWIRSITVGPQASGICRDNSRDMPTTPNKPACYSDLISLKTANSAAVTLIGENPQPLSQAHYIMPVFASLSLPPSSLFPFALSVSSIDLCTFFLYEIWKIIISSQEYACIHSCIHSFIDLCYYSNTFHICWKFPFTKEAFPNHLENGAQRVLHFHKLDIMTVALYCVWVVLYSLFTVQYQWQLQSKRERTAAPIIRFTTRKLHWPKSALLRRNPHEYPPLASSGTRYCPVYRWHFDFQICPLVIKWHVKDSAARTAVVGRDHCSRKEGEFASVLKLQLCNFPTNSRISIGFRVYAWTFFVYFI